MRNKLLFVSRLCTQTPKGSTPLIRLDESRRFIIDCFVAVGTPKPYAQICADVLTDTDYRGFLTHGLSRLEMYIDEIKFGICHVDIAPKIVKETPATALVNGRYALGMVNGTFCTDLAVKKAKDVGLGFVVCRNSNHYGAAGYYTLQMMKEGFMGITFTNTSPIVAPTRTKLPALGTNPLSAAADGFHLDITTSTAAYGKIQMKEVKKQKVPNTWRDPDTGALLPLGGDELHSSFKGYGLAVLVEVLTGIFSGGAYGPHVRMVFDFNKVGNICHSFLAIDPNCFAPEFSERMEEFLNTMRNLEPVIADKPVMVAGDAERRHMQLVDEEGGVRYMQEVFDRCRKIAVDLNVKPLQPLN